MEIINYACIGHTNYEIDLYFKFSLKFILKLKCNIYMHKKTHHSCYHSCIQNTFMCILIIYEYLL